MASQFYIMNEENERYSLNSALTGVFTEPKGFGIEYTNTYIEVGDSWVQNSSEVKQITPSGTIVFPVKGYEIYHDFVNFLNKAKRLILVYQPAGLVDEYFAEIDVIKLDKGGFSGGRLSVPVSFTCKTLFYTSEVFEYHIARASKEVRFPFTWETKFNDLNKIYFDFDNTGHVPAPYKVSFTGYAVNPEMIIVQDGKELVHISLAITLESWDKFELSTYDGELYCRLNGADAKSLLDFTNNNFDKLPVGVSEVYFLCEAGKLNNIEMSLEKYYKGV